RNVRATSVNSGKTRLNDLYAEEISILDNPAATRIESDNVRFSGLNSEAASLGSVNVAGVRLTIRQGRIEGRTADIDAGDVELTKSPTLRD
ncbi:hypothetical protein, partial [Vibrio cholerae]|uniref:hypothetical protein n=1 Tax=Vibrio cholerae TaxID=666 RepID=UPI001F45E7D1